MNYIIMDLDTPYGAFEANQIELVQPGAVGGDWTFNLLKDDKQVQPACTAPMGRDIISLTDLTSDNFKRDVQRHLFEQM